MSISQSEQRLTASELSQLRALLPAEDEALAERLGYTVDSFRAILEMRAGVDPRQVWRVRDFLAVLARDRGLVVPPFSVLKDPKRGSARMWFGSWEIPDTAGL